MAKRRAKEAGVQPDDVVLGLEPRDEALLTRFRHLAAPVGGADIAEPYEGAHLVDVAADALVEVVQPPDERVGRVVEQLRPVAQRRQRGVEEGEPFGVGVADHASGDVEERLGDGEHRFGRQRRRLAAAEQVGRRVADLPDDLLAGHARRRQPARRGAPAVEVVGPGEDGGGHCPMPAASCQRTPAPYR